MRFLIILFIIINLFSYDFKEIKTVIKSNSHKIDQILNSNRFTKWLLEHYPNIINKNIIGGFAKNPYNLYDKKYLKLFDRYSYPKANITKVIKSIDDKDHKELDKLTYHRFFSISLGELYLDDFLYTPLIYAILQKDKKIIKLFDKITDKIKNNECENLV